MVNARTLKKPVKRISRQGESRNSGSPAIVNWLQVTPDTPYRTSRYRTANLFDVQDITFFEINDQSAFIGIRL